MKTNDLARDEYYADSVDAATYTHIIYTSRADFIAAAEAAVATYDTTENPYAAAYAAFIDAEGDSK